jgi:anti-sigma factor RsiW
MNNHEWQLKLQAHLDGELPSKDASPVAGMLAGDAHAQALAAELKMTKDALQGNELDLKVPETREFYWTRIERAIQREEKTAARPVFARVIENWRRWLVPVTGVALAAIALFFAGPQAARPFDEIELATDEMGALTFRDQSAGVTMVWLYDRTPGAFTESMAFDNSQP